VQIGLACTPMSRVGRIVCLVMVIVLAFVSPAMVLVTLSVPVIEFATIIWVLIAILYCRYVGGKSALWIFALLPLVFGGLFLTYFIKYVWSGEF
jgi:hypothetical protein